MQCSRRKVEILLAGDGRIKYLINNSFELAFHIDYLFILALLMQGYINCCFMIALQISSTLNIFYEIQ